MLGLVYTLILVTSFLALAAVAVYALYRFLLGRR